MSIEIRQYLGDAVYCSFDGYSVILTTEDGISASNTIYLEPKVIKCLIDYLINVGMYKPKVCERSHNDESLGDKMSVRGFGKDYGVSLLSSEETAQVTDEISLMSNDWLINMLRSYKFMPTCHAIVLNELVKRGLNPDVESVKEKKDDIRMVKCCGSCEYADTDTDEIDGHVKTVCLAFYRRTVRSFELCNTFFPDPEVWSKEK